MSSSFRFGNHHATLQQYDCNHQNLEGLIKSLPSNGCPNKSWKSNPTPEQVTSWFPNDDSVAFYGPPNSDREPLTYAGLNQQIHSFAAYNTPNESSVFVVALLLPATLMGETAVTLLTLMNQHSKQGICVAPIDPNMPKRKIVAAIEQMQCTALVSTQELLQMLPEELMEGLRDIRLVTPSASVNQIGAVDWNITKHETLEQADFGLSGAARPALLLRTSGTTATPKMVPLTTTSLLHNAICLAASLQLDPREATGCNAMPLFHIGGIACNLLTVLVSGSSVVMLPGSYDSHAFFDAVTTMTYGKSFRQPTWYSGVPSMHKALLLTARASPSQIKKNRLRFIRSGAAHLPHGTAVELAQVFDTHVYPTYSMSECMPISSCHDAPVRAKFKDDVAEPTGTADSDSESGEEEGVELFRDGVPNDTVGIPTGSSLAITDEEGNILPYGTIGQVSLKGPGVIDGYIGIPLSKSHTAEGWFLTGDMGTLDRNGRLVLSGRQKEMIKRGGDQVWPNEVDGVVEGVEGIRMAVTFSVANELWGEEVHVAVILDAEAAKSITEDKKTLEENIRQACREELGQASSPSKVHYVDGLEALPKGSTGKFLRNKMATHLGAVAVDTGALNALEAMAKTTPNSKPPPKPHATPSPALNGFRFITACWVTQYHVGFMPNAGWAKLQTFTFNMTIFFALAAYQLATSVKSEVKSTSAQFIGTKIGGMHSFFMISQLIALPTLLMMRCGEGGYDEVFRDQSCTESLPLILIAWLWNTVTGMGGWSMDLSNPPNWYMTSFYTFLLFFPILDWHLRQKSHGYTVGVFCLCIVLATAVPSILYLGGGLALFMGHFRLLTWVPSMVAAMICGHWFSNHGTTAARSLLQRPRLWGHITDTVSLLFVGSLILAAALPGCMYMTLENYEEARPGEPLPEHSKGAYPVVPTEFEVQLYGIYLPVSDPVEYTPGPVCDLTYDEWKEYIHDEPILDSNFGRWQTSFGFIYGFARASTPLVMLWLFGLSYGHGLTAWLTQTRVLQLLAPYAYPLYLLHVPIARLYYVATRGHQAEYWWIMEGAYAIPVEWWELIIIIVICVALAAVLERLVVQHLTTYTIQYGVMICKYISKFLACEPAGSDLTDTDSESSVSDQVEGLVKALTGTEDVDQNTRLAELGLDSLGATALLGALRSAAPTAKTLTLAQLSSCDTVGDLVLVLEPEVTAQKANGASAEAEETKKVPEATATLSSMSSLSDGRIDYHDIRGLETEVEV